MIFSLSSLSFFFLGGGGGEGGRGSSELIWDTIGGEPQNISCEKGGGVIIY